MTINQHSEAEPAAYLEFTLGDRLSRSLRHADMGVSEIAEIMGVGRETISRWMHDRNAPKRAALLAWASITNVDVTWLETGQAPTVRSEPDELRACRDSNPKPSDLYSIAGRPPLRLVKASLTENRRLEIARTRHLRSVS